MKQSAPDCFLRLEGIRKAFGGLVVVEDLSMAVRQGEFISILGPSGCGKTTLLRIIAGFIEARGAIWLDGDRIDAVPSHRRGAAMVFQNYALFPHMTVFENIAFGLRRQKTPKPEIQRRVVEALELVQLPGFEKRYPRELSGGQQQRVALARAIVLRPKLLLLDEPLSNLDAKLRKGLRQEFLRIHRMAGITSLFVTHDLEEAFSISDRVAVMNRGRIEQFAAPVEIFTAPRTPFVSDFVGHSNVVEGQVTSGPQGPVLTMGGLVLRITPDAATQRALRMAIPAHLVRISAGPCVSDNCFKAKLMAVSYLGTAIHFTVDLGGLTLSGEAPATAETLRLAAGQEAFVGWNAADMIQLPERGSA